MSEKIKLNIQWWVPWTAGALFTMGFIDFLEPITDVGEGLALLFVLYFSWPLFLGAQLGGG